MDLSEIKQVKIDYIKTPIAFRPVDEWLIAHIFQVQEYALPLNPFKPKFILDCGANVGFSTVYFANKYPESTIVAVEPEKENFKLLTYNTILYDNVNCINSALLNEEKYIKSVGTGAGSSIKEITSNEPKTLKTTTISKLLADFGFDEIDLLKMDIEGSEKEVFSDMQGLGYHEWLPKVKILVMELHDRVKRGCSQVVFRAISDYNFFFTIRGENVIFIRDELVENGDEFGNIYAEY